MRHKKPLLTFLHQILFILILCFLSLPRYVCITFIFWVYRLFIVLLCFWIWYGVVFLRLIFTMGRIYFFFVRFQMYLSFVFLYHCVFELNLRLFASLGGATGICNFTGFRVEPPLYFVTIIHIPSCNPLSSSVATLTNESKIVAFVEKDSIKVIIFTNLYYEYEFWFEFVFFLDTYIITLWEIWNASIKMNPWLKLNLFI